MHGLLDVLEIVVRVLLGVKHAPQRLDAHMLAKLHHCEVTDANEVGQRLPELVRGHATVYHGAASVYLPNRQHPRYDAPTHGTTVKACDAAEVALYEPRGHLVGNLLHAGKIRLRRVRIKAG